MDKQEMMDLAELKAKELLLPPLKAYVQVLVKDIAMAALQDVVADTENPYDDMLLAAVAPVVDAKLKELLGD